MEATEGSRRWPGRFVEDWREHADRRWTASILLWLACVGVSALLVGLLASVILWAMLLVHELAHLLVARSRSAPLWVPGVGAVLLEEPDRPVTALAGGLACLPLTVAMSGVSPTAATICCAFHIVALAPIPPLDGGWVTGWGPWSYASALPLLVAFNALAAAAVVACLLRLDVPRSPSRVALVGWACLWAAWWGVGLWAPWA